MGACGGKQTKTTTLMRISTVTGVLKITITTAIIVHEASMFKMDPYITLKISNQKFETKVISNGDKQPEFFQTFTFHINSCYKIHGRDLQFAVFDKQKVGGDNEIGFGIADIDPVIRFKKPREELRCFINYDRKQAGFINYVAEFTEEQSKTLSFRFLFADIERSTSRVGNMNCFVKVVIGEEALSTSKQIDTKQTPPIWKSEILTFVVPYSIKQCEIFVFDDKTQVGKLRMSLGSILNGELQQNFEQVFRHKEKTAGTLKFNTFIGENPHFSQLLPIEFRKSKKVHEQKVKEETKEQKKQKQNKEEKQKSKQQKKEQQRKEQKKEQEKEEEKEQPKEQKKEEEKGEQKIQEKQKVNEENNMINQQKRDGQQIMT